MSAGLQTSRGGNGILGITSLTATMPTVSTTVTLIAPSSIVTISNYSTNSIGLYVNLNGAATTSNFQILANTALTYDGVPISSFQIIAPGATTDQYGVFAH